MTQFFPSMSYRNAGLGHEPDLSAMIRAYTGKRIHASNTIEDKSSNNAHLSPGSVASWVHDDYMNRPVLQFNGTGGIALPVLALDETDMTVAYWSQIDTETEQRYLTLNPATTPSVQGIFSTVTSNKRADTLAVQNDSTFQYIGSLQEQFDWHHIAIRSTESGGIYTVEYFSDGEIIETDTYTPSNVGSGTPYWGASRLNTLAMRGRMIDLLIGPALTDDEIVWLANRRNFLP